MRLTVIGCSGSYPGPDSPASCYLVQAEGVDAEGTPRTWSLVLDLGNGALGLLQRYIDPLAIDAVLLSHLHADHCLDMTSYYVMRKYHPSGTQPRIPVWGPDGTAGRLASAYDLPRRPGMREEFEFHSYSERIGDQPGSFSVGPFEITAAEVDHPVPAYGLRISANGRTLAYSGDTGPTPALLELAKDVDLFLVEASFREVDDNPPSLHLTGAEAGQYAADAAAKRVVVTHVPPWHDAAEILAEAKDTFPGDLELAATGAVYQV